ncbi:L-seryl-tRNA(Sec) selenium transferase [Bacillus sp. 1P06AnD]|uniref:L-seryl-tRNA(Sec) selenium transferase n=1 Tax=Bacillus sp. 1P06AnD TaxID=3132208 RepID=UPI00399FAAD2
MKEYLKDIPAIHELQKSEGFQHFIEKHGFGKNQGTKVMSTVIERIRSSIMKSEWTGCLPGESGFIEEIFRLCNGLAEEDYSYRLKKVINATGVVLHTNMGRARLSREAIAHIADIAGNYSNLEYDVKNGSRGSRNSHVEKWINELTGAEASMVVNNNAAAVFLILHTLAKGSEVIISRGQLIEIGGSFRISSIMEESGAVIKEVGTTNRTHLYDYEQNITEHTKLLMKVHLSNFKMSGFTSDVSTDQLADLAEKKGLWFYEDLGSGVLSDFRNAGIGEEPTVKETLLQGCHLVSFSGDKLLGGPQAGIIAGKKELVDKLKHSQLARILRVDKLSLAALEAVLLAYLKSEGGSLDNPLVQDLMKNPEMLKEQGEKLATEILEHPSGVFQIEIMETENAVGGGTMPGVTVIGYAVSIAVEGFTASEIERKLRSNNPPIIPRVHGGKVLIELRTLCNGDEAEIVAAFHRLV